MVVLTSHKRLQLHMDGENRQVIMVLTECLQVHTEGDVNRPQCSLHFDAWVIPYLL